jgi:hypothetical protein
VAHTRPPGLIFSSKSANTKACVPLDNYLLSWKPIAANKQQAFDSLVELMIGGNDDDDDDDIMDQRRPIILDSGCGTQGKISFCWVNGIPIIG